jgi:nicotinamidase-related amidase
MKPALVLVDIQQDYFPGGKMEVVGAVEASRAARRLLGFFRERNLPIVHVQHVSLREGSTFLLPNTDGVNFHENVRPLAEEVVIKKHFPNSFRQTQLRPYLSSRGVAEIAICGMMSQMCIDATVRAAFDLGYACMVPHDACAARGVSFGGRDVPAPQVHAAFMAALGAVYARVLSADELMATLQQA